MFIFKGNVLMQQVQVLHVRFHNKIKTESDIAPDGFREYTYMSTLTSKKVQRSN